MDTKRKDMLVYVVIILLFIAFFWLYTHHPEQASVGNSEKIHLSDAVQIKRWEESEKLVIDKAKTNPKVTIQSNKTHIRSNEYIIITLAIETEHPMDQIALDFNTPFEKEGIVNIIGITKLSDTVYQIRCTLLANPGSTITLHTPKGLVTDTKGGLSDYSNDITISRENV